MSNTQRQLERPAGLPDKKPAEPLQFKIETMKLFQVKTPDGDISTTGINLLGNYLFGQHNRELPNDFEYVWTTKRGTLPKRVQVYFYKVFGIKLTTEQISEVGNLSRRHASIGETYTLDFTNDISWYAGDFGDDGSCFWGDRSAAKDMLEEHGYALRAYKMKPDASGLNYNSVRGYARAWIAPLEDDKLIVFNGYGETTLLFARLLSLYYSCAYQKIGLTNNGCSDGTMYINNGGYIIGEHAKIQSVTNHELGWEDLADDREECFHCGEHYCEDDMRFVESRGRSACINCVGGCDRCDDYFLLENTVRDEVDRNRYCFPCHEQIVEARDEANAMEEQEAELVGEVD